MDSFLGSFRVSTKPGQLHCTGAVYTRPMCGRYMLTSPVEALRQLFLFEEQPNLRPRYNAAPTDELPIVRRSKRGKRELVIARWGLIPYWAKDKGIGYRTINARADSLHIKPAFREAYRKRRCLVLANGFYESVKAAKSECIPIHALVFWTCCAMPG